MNKKQAVSKGRNMPNARTLAARLLVRWQGTDAARRTSLSSLVQEEAAKLPLSEDRGLLAEIVTGSVRWLRLLTAVVDSRLKKPEKIPLVVKGVLLTAIYQILFLDRVPGFAVVNEAVKTVKKLKASWASGLVNAVLRQILRECEQGGRSGVVDGAVKGARNSADEVAIRESYPTWMVKRWAGQHGMEVTERICRAGNSYPVLSLRVNTLKISRQEAVKLLEDAGIKVEISTISPHGVILPGFRGNPAGLPGFSQGFFQVQDQSAQLVSLLLQCASGHKILDMCSGLGGKTTHIAEITGDTAKVDAWDTNKKRLAQLEENARRLGISSINILSESDFEAFKRGSDGVYHRILIDAPCSGLGVIRRHPDIKWNRQPDDIKRLAGVQLGLLDTASGLLMPGGLLVYSVCTNEPEETADVIEKFLKKNGGWRVVSAGDLDVDIPAEYLTQEGFMSILPEEDGPDGFFACVLSRNV